MFLFKVIRVLSIAKHVAFPFRKICVNCHVANIIIFPMGGVHCNTCHSKSTIEKLGYSRGFITTNDELVLLTIEGKWLETIMHMTKFEFLDLFHSKQVQFFISHSR